MIPYFLLLLIPLSLQEWLKSSNKTLCIRKNRCLTGENIALPAFLFLFSAMLILRDKSLGRDLTNYNYIFNIWGNATLSSVFSQYSECLFKFYCWFIYNYISSNYQVFISLTALITVVPIAFVYNQDKTHGYVKASIFVNMSTFIMLFSGIRQGLAISVGALAYYFVSKSKFFRYAICVIIASLLHHTGFMTLFFLPLCKIKSKKKDLIWIIASFSVVFVFRKNIFNVLVNILGSSDERYSATAESTGAFGSLILFSLFTVLCFVIVDESRADDETLMLRNILVFATIFQTFASVNTLAMRMNYYFIILIPITIGKCLNCMEREKEEIARLSETIMSIFFTALFMYSIYESYITGISTLDTVPYITFWKE